MKCKRLDCVNELSVTQAREGVYCSRACSGIARTENSAHRQRIHQRRSGQRARTIAPKRLSLAELREVELLQDGVTVQRPRTRGDCQYAQRPCPWVSCKHHLFLDVNPSGGLKINHPGIEPDELSQTCALDVAEHDGETLEYVAGTMNITRERVRQIEVRALLKVRASEVNE